MNENPVKCVVTPLADSVCNVTLQNVQIAELAALQIALEDFAAARERDGASFDGIGAPAMALRARRAAIFCHNAARAILLAEYQ
jgi:hypothetical protein